MSDFKVHDDLEDVDTGEEVTPDSSLTVEVSTFTQQNMAGLDHVKSVQWSDILTTTCGYNESDNYSDVISVDCSEFLPSNAFHVNTYTTPVSYYLKLAPDENWHLSTINAAVFPSCEPVSTSLV